MPYRLKAIKSNLGKLSGSLSFGNAGQPSSASPTWKRWYHTKRWQRLRWEVLVRDSFRCRMCRRIQPDTAQLVADHIKAHRGDPNLFWDRDNLQALCAECHSGEKQRQEKQAGPAGLWD